MRKLGDVTNHSHGLLKGRARLESSLGAEMSRCNPEDLREAQDSRGLAGHDSTYIESRPWDTVICRSDSLTLADQVARNSVSKRLLMDNCQESLS